MRLALILAVQALQALPPAVKSQSLRARLEGRVPAAAIPTVDSLALVAAREGLPTEPLLQKALEGGAKGVSTQRIVAAVQAGLAQLRDARALLVRAGDAPPVTAAEVTSVSAALRRGVPAQIVARVVAASPDEPRGSALHAVADLVAHGFPADSSAELIFAAMHQGLRGERLLDVATAAVHELQRGRTPGEALGLVRAGLPDVPAAPKPAPATVVRARRPAAAPPQP